MRTIGAKVPDELYDECSSVQRLLGIRSRSDYVRLAFRLLNGAIHRAAEEARLTMAIKPESKSGEPLTAAGTETSESSRPDTAAKEGES